MKKWITGFSLCMPLVCGAENFALNFDHISLVNFAQATYKVMLKRNYVLSSDLLSMEKPISVSVRNIDSAALPQLIERILEEHGVRAIQRNGIYFLSPFSSNGSTALPGGRAMRLSGDVVNQYPSLDTPLPRTASNDGMADTNISTRDHLEADRAIAEERIIYRPVNRKSDFIATALNAISTGKGAVVAGGVVILSAPKEQISKLLDLASQIDTAPHKVKISATFVEVSTSASSGFGVSLIANLLGAKLGIKIGDTSTGSLNISGSSFQAVLDVLSSDGRFRQVSNPSAVVDDYDKTNISFGDSVPTIGSSSLDKNGNPIQQIVYQQSGVLLDVTPRVLGSGKINVTLDGQVSSFSSTTTGVSSSPTLSKRQVQTSLTLDDGELLVIGGLNSNKAANNASGLSFLPKALAIHSDSSANTDLLLILSATVVR